MAEKKKKKPFNLQYFLRSRRYLMISLMFGGVCIVMTLFVISPRVTSILSVLEERGKEQKALKVLRNKEQILNTVEEIDVYSDQERIHSILPSTKPVLTILRQIEGLAAEHQVIISEFSVSPGKISTESATEAEQKQTPQEENGTEIVETEAVIVGRIENINLFLRGINTITPLTQTSSLTLKSLNRAGASADASDEAKVFEAGVALSSYFYVKELEATQPNSALPELTMTDEMRKILDEFNFTANTSVRNPALLPIEVQGGGKENLFE